MGRRQDTITDAEAVRTCKKLRPELTVRQIAQIFGIGKTKVGRILKPGICPTCGTIREETNGNAKG